MILPEPLLKHIDAKSLELVNSLQTTENPESEPQVLVGSINEKISVDWSDKIDTSLPMKFFTTNSVGQKVEVWMQEGNALHGFDEESFKKYSAFINSLYKKFEFNSVVSLDFLDSIIFDWLIQTYKNNQASTNLSEFIVQEIKQSIVTKVYCFPILYLEIDFSIQIGPVTIKCFTEGDFDEMDAIYVKKHGHKNDDSTLREEYQGAVVACIEVTAESRKAKEIAFEKCSLAVDILKIYSRTFLEPDVILDFDLDARAKTQMKNLILAHKPGSMEGFAVSMNRIAESASFGHYNTKYMNDLHFSMVAAFVFKDGEKNELTKMLINAISNFADALSTKNLHKRIAEIFTIFESLLLPNADAGILHSLTTYAPKLITTNPEMRKDVKKLIGNLYKIRSSLMHHGKHQHFDMEDLRKLQLALLCLIVELMLKSQTHKKKSDVLEEIDDAINKAY